MIFAKNDEEKRSKLWRIVMTVTTILILLITAYFLFQLFAGNPLAGKWVSEDGDVVLTIRKGNAAVATCMDLTEASDVKVDLQYTLDKEAKTISFQIDENSMKKELEKSDGHLTEDAIYMEIGALENTFDYNMSRAKLTLAEREYGEKIVFVRK